MSASAGAWWLLEDVLAEAIIRNIALRTWWLRHGADMALQKGRFCATRNSA